MEQMSPPQDSHGGLPDLLLTSSFRLLFLSCVSEGNGPHIENHHRADLTERLLWTWEVSRQPAKARAVARPALPS